MNALTSNSMLMMERSLNFLWTKQVAILDNLGNVETPNYKAKYVTFEEALRSRLQSASSVKDMRQVIDTAAPTVHVAENESARMDENGVDATEQTIEMARNAIQMQTVMNAISGDYTLLRTVIRGQ